VVATRRSYSIPLRTGSALTLGARTLVMGILNVTPDSFAESGSRLDPHEAIEAALRMEAEGADLIDIGGESTRPGAQGVPAGEELARIMPVIDGLAGRLGVPISVDTWKSEVARQAVAAGAAIVNDVTSLHGDSALAGVVAETGAALVLMHMRGRFEDMYAQAQYTDLMGEIAGELGSRLALAIRAGIPVTHILLDPGIGFAKHASHSYGVLSRLPELAAALDRPLLVGPSRKSFMREAVGDKAAPERDWGTAAAVSAAVLGGAHIVRVHAVAPMIQVVRVADEIRRYASEEPQ
jgi:dihydropteroate synthase